MTYPFDSAEKVARSLRETREGQPTLFVCARGHSIRQPDRMWCPTCGAPIYVRARPEGRAS